MAEKWIIDTDGGIDDTFGIVLALSQPKEFQVLALTIVAGNLPLEIAAASVARTLEICQVKIPIYLGAPEGIIMHVEPIYHVHGKNGQGDAPEYADLKGYTDCIDHEKHAVDFIVEQANKHPGDISILTIGPLTNMALALKMDPSISKKIKRVVSMGGTNNGKGNTSWSAEFNFYSDPDAALICLREMPFTEIVAAEVGDEFYFTPSELEQWLNKKTRKGHFLHCIDEHLIKMYQRPFIYDAIAAGVAMRKALVTKAQVSAVKVETRGRDTRGTLLIDWLHKSKAVPSTIVMEINHSEMVKMLIASTS